MAGRGLAENVRIPSYRERGLKLLKKPSYDIYSYLLVSMFCFFSGRYNLLIFWCDTGIGLNIKKNSMLIVTKL